jgi:hypothetical protein
MGEIAVQPKECGATAARGLFVVGLDDDAVVEEMLDDVGDGRKAEVQGAGQGRSGHLGPQAEVAQDPSLVLVLTFGHH